jgi:hypothetical protein
MSGQVATAKPRPGRFDRAEGRTALQQVFNFQDRMLLERVLTPLRFEPAAGVLADVPTKALIACTARSGSSLMSAALQRYDLAFEEYLNPEGYVRRVAAEQPGASVNDFARRLKTDATRNGVLTIKSSPLAILYLAAMGEIPDRIGEWKIVFLRRRNVVRQAVSGYIAEKTGAWTSSMAATGTVSEADYAFGRILSVMDTYVANNERWERFFGLFGIEPLRVFYEDYVADLAGGTEQVARYIGVDVGAFPNAHAHQPQLESQSTPLNKIWEERFREDVLSRARRAVSDAVRSAGAG